jgi:hypothetical protein
MKKISLIALALFTSLAVFSQGQPQLRTQTARATFFGIKAGANWAKFDVDEFPGTSVNNKTSLHAGVFLNLPIGARNLNFQPELLYNAVGSKMRTTTTVGSVTTEQPYEQDLSYISLPLMFQIRTPNGLFIELGPQPSFLISAKQEGPGNTDTDNKASFDKFDLAMNAGIGFTTRVGFGVHARYSYGLTNVLEDGGGNNSPNDGPELKNRVLQVGLHYMFGANK